MSTIEQLAARLGALSWVSAELFAVEGRWAASMTSSAAVEHLATHSRHHGWHAQLLADALPDSPALGARRHVASPTAGWARAFDTVAATTADAGTDSYRLSALYRCFVPRLVALMADLTSDLGDPGDAAVARIVAIVDLDVMADLRGGVRILATTLGDDEAVEVAASSTKALDQAFRT